MSTAAPLSTAADHAPAAASGSNRMLLLLAFFYLLSGTLMLALTTAYSALTL